LSDFESLIVATLPLHKAILLRGRLDPIVIYPLGRRGVVRVVSSLTGERVKKDPKFKHTMANAAVLGRASRIASFVYGELPKAFRQFWMYKAFTGEAIHLLREGKTDKEAKDILWKTYAEIWVIKAKRTQVPVDSPNKGKIKTYKREKIIQVSPMPSLYSMPIQQHRYLQVKGSKKKKKVFAWPP
jgi:hypothetical protein